MSRRKKRPLSAEERSLWHAVAKTVAPLPEKQAPQMPAPEASTLAIPPRKADDGRNADPTPAAAKRNVLQPVDPQREKRVARGKLEIDAVIDLHGMRQEEADRATSAFISRSISKGHRVLLVITGKGSKDSEHGRGVLRRRFLHGVEVGLFGSGLASVRPAHQRHGGTGAFYVFLKPQRKTSLRREPVTKGSRSISKRPRG